MNTKRKAPQAVANGPPIAQTQEAASNAPAVLSERSAAPGSKQEPLDDRQFAATVRREFCDDSELRESLKTYGWNKELPAIKDESGFVLMGNRRIKIAAEEGIQPVIKTITFGEGKASDAERTKLAIVSNLGAAPLAPADRKRIAEHLYGDREWTMARIGEALGVSKKTISLDLKDVVTQGNNPPRPKDGRPKGGRPKGRQSKKSPEDTIADIRAAQARGEHTNDGRDLAADLAAAPEPVAVAGKTTSIVPDAPADTIQKTAVAKPTVILKTHLGDEVPYPKPQGKATFNRTNEQVSWSAWTWNPVTGCLHGCKYCYARELATKASMKEFYPVGFTPLFHHERLDAPANTKVPSEADTDARLRRVFVCSMADLYGKWVPDEWIEQVHARCIDNPQWDYLMLTKFPRRYVGLKLPPSAWLGTSIDEQKRVRLAEDAFRQIKNVRVKWLSLEPLLAPLQFTDLSMFDWIVIGSQSATKQPDGPVPAFAPPFDWVARLYAQARECGCRIYLKPNLLGVPNSQCPGMTLTQEEPDQSAITIAPQAAEAPAGA